MKTETSKRTAASQPLGNYYDKYNTRNPIEKYLVSNFFKSVFRALAPVRPASILDIGCGEGIVTEMLQEKYSESAIIATDTDHSFVNQVATTRVKVPVINALPNLCFPNGAFELVVLLEVLEHLPHPDKSIREIRRVTDHHLIVTVPHEPWWRMCNILRFKYLRDLGNTPGHINHFSRSSLADLLNRHFSRVQVRSVFPWLLAMCEV